MEKHYVTYNFPGSFFAEQSTKEINFRDIKIPIEDIPENCYSYSYFSREEVILDGETLSGKPKNISRTYYPGGKIITIDDIPDIPKNDILRNNIKYNGYQEKGILTKVGNYQWLCVGDIVY